MRLIDADTLKAEFTGNFNELWHYIAIKALIDCAPTIDPKDSRPKCTWKQIDEDAWECSNCGVLWTCIDGDPTDNDMHFCPVCGAEIEKVVE